MHCHRFGATDELKHRRTTISTDDDDDDDNKTWIYIAHRHKISNALNTLVLRQKECFQHLFEGRFCIAGISDIVRQQVPNSGAGDSKCPTGREAAGANL